MIPVQRDKRHLNLNTEICVLLGITAVALAVRLFNLGAQSLWYDEGYSVYVASKDLAQLTFETAQDIQPPLYYYLLHFWLAFFAQSEQAVRGLSVLFGWLTVPLFYLLARQMFSSATGLLAAWFAALSPLYLWYSQEARMYTLLVMLTLCSSYFLWLALEDSNPVTRRWKWVGAALSLILALYTHYFASFVLAFQVFYVLIAWHSGWGCFRRIEGRLGCPLRESIVALAASVIAYLPWLPYMFGRYRADVSYWEGRLKLDEALRKIGIVFSGGESVLEDTGVWLALGFTACLLVSFVAVLTTRSRPRTQAARNVFASPPGARLAYLGLYVSAPLALLLWTTYWTPKFNPRYAMIASPPLFIVLAAGIVAFWQARATVLRLVALGIAVFVMAVMLYADYNLFFDIRFSKPDFRGAVDWVQTHQNEGEVVILTSGHAFPVFDYYYSGDNWHPLPAEQRTLSTKDVLRYEVATDLNRLLKGKIGAWLVLWQDEVVDPNGYVTMLLDQYAHPQPVPASFYHVRVKHYALPSTFHVPERPEIARPMSVNLGNALTLLGFSPGITETVYLYWEARRPLEEDYKVSLRLKDASGFNWSDPTGDSRLAAPLYPTTRWRPGELVVGRHYLAALPGTPPGPYKLDAVVYAEDAPQPLDVLDEAGAPKGKVVELGPVFRDRLQPATQEQLGVSGAPIITWAGQIALLGYRKDRSDVQAGDEVHLELFWQALNPIAVDYELRLGWRQGEKVLASESHSPAGAGFPTSAWNAGDLIRGQYTLAVPLEIEPGPVDTLVGLFSSGPAAASFNQWFALTSLNAQPTERVFEPPAMALPLNVNFADQVELLGADLSVSRRDDNQRLVLKPGDSFEVVLFWKALSRMEKSYTVFVHLLDAENRIRAQEDRVPAAGARPTTGWVTGEVIQDGYRLQVDPAAPPGDYVLEVGLYDGGNPAFPRLTVLQDGAANGDRAIIAEMAVIS